jgi:hypothetical protein
VYCDFYFLLEMGGILRIPKPHAELMRDSPFPAHLEEALAQLREACIALGAASDDLFKEAFALKNHLQLASLLERIGVGRENSVRLIDAAVAGRAQIVSVADAAACARLVQRVDEMLRGRRVAMVFGELRAFLSIGPDDLPLTVTPYPLSSACGVSFGSLTGDLVTLGVHPHMAPERVIGIIVHEAIHVWVDGHLQQTEAGNAQIRSLAEPLATAIGNGWTIEQLTGALPRDPWYDEASVEKSARRLFQSIATAISAGERFESVAPELFRTLKESEAF